MNSSCSQYFWDFNHTHIRPLNIDLLDAEFLLILFILCPLCPSVWVVSIALY